MPKYNNIEPLLDEVFSTLAVKLQAQDADKDEVLSIIGTNYGSTLIKMVLQGLIEDGRLQEKENIISFSIDDINEPKILKITPGDRELFKFLSNKRIKNKILDKEIDGKRIWGIGKKAITLVDGITYDYSCEHPRVAIGSKDFHNFKKEGIKNKHTSYDGIEIMRKIAKKYQKELTSDVSKEKAIKIRKIIDELYEAI